MITAVSVILCTLITVSGVWYSARKSAQAATSTAKSQEKASDISAIGPAFEVWQATVAEVKAENATFKTDLATCKAQVAGFELREKRMELRINQLETCMREADIELPPWPTLAANGTES